ncbi:MAG: glycoside hydrolase family 3 C-terminal domain-containing protein [Bacilli bacterium]|nr:glycoside hydrolase family 3 C-terminal domain-containing protein [Bacilli bacterium]
MKTSKLLLGLTSVGVLLSTILFAGQKVADMNEGLINDFLGLTASKVDKIDSDLVEGSAYKDANGNLTDDGFYQMIEDSYAYCEDAVEQGSVLLKNDNNALPLKAEERKVTLFGQASRNLFMRSGAGGAAPNETFMVKLDQAFIENGFSINKTLWNKYQALELKNICDPDTNRECAVSVYQGSDVVSSYNDYNDAAIITFMRAGTEDNDPNAGMLNLHNNEKALLQYVKTLKDSGVFKKVILLLNSPMPMSMGYIEQEEYGIDAAVWMGVPGYYGAGGIVHVLMGKDGTGEDAKLVNPSGHCPDTFAANADSSAAHVNFGNNQVVVYKEGVYVGYKYYETRYEDLVLGNGNANSTKGTYESTGAWDYAAEMGYPFGFGLSYTTFEEELVSVSFDKETDEIVAKVKVKNTGDMDGKASIQLYTQQPYTQFDRENGLGKSAIALMAYDKVDVKKGETKEVEVRFDRYFLATYDYVVNRTYILEGGTYYFSVGNGAHEALNNVIGYKNESIELIDHNGNPVTANKKAVKELQISEDLTTYAKSHYSDVDVENQFDDADYNYLAQKNNKTPIVYLDRTDWEGTWPTATTTSPASSADLNMANYYKKAADTPSYKEGDGSEYNVPYVDPTTGEESVIKFSEMHSVPLEGQVTDENSRFYGQEGADVWDMFIKQMTLDDLIISVSDNRGILDVAKVYKKGNSVAEGPEGLLQRFQYGDKRWATGFPTGPTYTATWDHEMQRKFGGFYGEEALYAGVAAVNAPGANINRTPYGSRASEYMSEDGVMNYNVASNVIGEARRKGLIMNIKHCFLNNQETGRQRVQTYCNEQAIREIYLRPFEGALTKGHGLGIMTSYNRIGARYAATHEPLMLNVMRGEWNYRGYIIDDALTGNNTDQYSNGPAMLYCGTDLFCLDGGRGGQLRDYIKQNDDGTLLACLQRANKYIMYSVSRSWMGGIEVSDEEMKATPAWKTGVTVTVWAFAALTVVAAGLYVFFEISSRKSKED